MNDIITKGISNGISYEAYRELIDTLLAEGKATGLDQSEKRVADTRLNVARMRRNDKTIVILDEVREALSSIDRPQTWLIITEGWCGDSSQVIPVINRMAEINPAITLKHVMRDENDDLMNLFLTNGAKSIPKIIVIDEESREVIGTWGPRPAELQAKAIARKNDPNPISSHDFAIQTQQWYNADKGVSIQKEFIECVELRVHRV
ncbi:MAG: thioredoxin family protein [Candidatus Kapaibacterium sp.]